MSPLTDLVEPPTLPLRSTEGHTNTTQVDELGHQSCRGQWLLEERRHQPSYLLGNLDEGKSEKVFSPTFMVFARLSCLLSDRG